MAILGPSNLPVVCQVDSDPLKLHVLSQLGHPNVLVELGEVQLEQILRSTGDFIVRYFPLQEKLAYFWTVPLQNDYPIPDDAYWVRAVQWTPNIQTYYDIFSAESFLFCFAGGTIILTENGPKQCEEIYENPELKIITPFGPRKPRLKWNPKKQPITMLKTEKDFLCCTPNHSISCNGEFRPASSCKIGDYLLNNNDKKAKIVDTHNSETEGTWTIQSRAGCLYVSSKGEEFYLSH